MSRLLTTLLLYRQGYVIGRYISLESKIEKNKESYYITLKKSGIGWHENKENPVPFIKYLLRTILAAYIDFEERVDYVNEKMPTLELVRGAVDRKIGKFTKKDRPSPPATGGRIPSVSLFNYILLDNYSRWFYFKRIHDFFCF